MKKFFLGKNPVSSIVGYLLLTLQTIDVLTTAGETNWKRLAFGVALAILGRASADSKNTKRTYMLMGFIGLASLAGCSHKMQPPIIIRDSITTVIEVDSFWETHPVYVPGETITLHDTIPCPGVSYTATITGKTGRVTGSVKLHNNRLFFECKADSLTLVLDSLLRVNRTINTTKKETQIVTVEVPKRYIPKWVWWLIAFNVAAIAWRLRHGIIGIFSKI
jgi:hypothetical protein